MPSARKQTVGFIRERHGCSERRACRVLSANRCTVRRPKPDDKDRALRLRMRELAEEKRRYGVERLHILLKREGLVINHKRTERIYREEQLSLRGKRKKKKLSRMRVVSPTPTGPNQKRELDFVSDQLQNGRRFKVLTIVDIWDRLSPALEVDTSITGSHVVAVLERLREQGSLPGILHVDNGPEFTCKALDEWAYEHGVRIEFSRPGKPTDKAHIESFNGRLRDECLDTNLFSSIADARCQIERWRGEYNCARPHSALGWRSPMEYRNIFIEPSTAKNTNLSAA